MPTTPQIQGTILGLAVTLTGATATHRSAPLDPDRLVRAIGQIESGNRNLPAAWDTNGLAFGLYQFHLPRWRELGGTEKNFGKASVKEQTRLLRRAIVKRKFQTFEQVSRWQNGIKLPGDPYAKKLARAYRSK